MTQLIQILEKTVSPGKRFFSCCFCYFYIVISINIITLSHFFSCVCRCRGRWSSIHDLSAHKINDIWIMSDAFSEHFIVEFFSSSSISSWNAISRQFQLFRTETLLRIICTMLFEFLAATKKVRFCSRIWMAYKHGVCMQPFFRVFFMLRDM